MTRKDKVYHYTLTVIITFLTCFLFWFSIVKPYIENYIKEEYGNSIKQTYNNSELIKDLLNDS